MRIAEAQVQQPANPPASKPEQDRLREQRQQKPSGIGNSPSTKPPNGSTDRVQQRKKEQIHKPPANRVPSNKSPSQSG